MGEGGPDAVSAGGFEVGSAIDCEEIRAGGVMGPRRWR